MAAQDINCQWRDELLHQKQRLQSDMAPRIVAALLALGMGGLFVGLSRTSILIAIFALSELVQYKLFANMDIRNDGLPFSRIEYVVFILNSLMGASAWTIMVLLLWLHPSPMVNFVSLVFLCGGFVNTIVVHSHHLPVGIANAAPMSVVLLLMPLRDLHQPGNAAEIIFGVGAAILLIGYYGSVMRNYNHMTRDLYSSRQEAVRSNEAKSRFLAEISHDIRTPMNAIMGATRLMQIGDAAAHDRSVAMLERSAFALQTIIEDALAAGESNSALGQFNPAPAHLARDLAQTLASFEDKSLSRGTKWRVILDDRIPELAVFDPVMLRRCLSRLVAQIMKDAPGAAVSIAAKRLYEPTGQTDTPALLEITITDLHLPEAAIYDIDFRAALTLATTMGGDIGISHDTLTTTLRLVVPIPGIAAEAQETSQENVAIDLPLRVLVVDDIATNRFIVMQLLKGENFLPTEVDGGAAALLALKTQTFDVVLLDMNMPLMSGGDKFEAIRHAGETWSQVPVIALTANALAEQRYGYMALGISGYIAKPVDRSLLLAEIRRVLALA